MGFSEKSGFILGSGLFRILERENGLILTNNQLVSMEIKTEQLEAIFALLLQKLQ